MARLVKFPFSKTEEILVKTALLHNKVLAFPTETFYGLGGNAFARPEKELCGDINAPSMTYL